MCFFLRRAGLFFPVRPYFIVKINKNHMQYLMKMPKFHKSVDIFARLCYNIDSKVFNLQFF